MDFNKLSRGERILLVSSAVLFILSFVPYWGKFTGAEEAFGRLNFSAWSAAFGFLLKLGIFLSLVAAIAVLVRAAGAMPELPIGVGLAYVGLAGLVTLLVLLTILTGPSAPFVGRAFLLYLSIVPAGAMLYGGYLHMQEETAGTPGALGRPPGPSTRPGPPPAPGGTGTTAPPSSQEPPGSTRPGAPPPPPR